MKEIINERIKKLNVTQKYMTKISDLMEELDESQLSEENNAYNVINNSDKAVNIAKEGKKIITKLFEQYTDLMKNPTKESREEFLHLLDDTAQIIQNLLNTLRITNEVAHNLEMEIAYQRDITDNMKDTLPYIDASLNEAIVCTEMVLTLTDL